MSVSRPIRTLKVFGTARIISFVFVMSPLESLMARMFGIFREAGDGLDIDLDAAAHAGRVVVKDDRQRRRLRDPPIVVEDLLLIRNHEVRRDDRNALHALAASAIFVSRIASRVDSAPVPA